MNLVRYILSGISISVFSVSFANSQCSDQNDLDVQHEPGYLFSPEFPIKYPQTIGCVWKLVNKHENEVTILEYESLSSKSPISCRQNKLVFLYGSQTSIKCGDDSKFFMQIKNETVVITFSTVNNDVDTGFKIKYYSIPIDNSTCSNATVNIKVSRNHSRIVSAPIQVSGLSCRWEVTAENQSDIIVLEALGSNTQASRDWQIKIRENMTIESPVELSGLIDSKVRYYRSATNKIVVQLNYALPSYNGSEEEVIAISFTSLQNDDFPRKRMQVDSVPMYFYIPPYDHNKMTSDQPEISFLSTKKCIEATLLTSNMSALNIALTEYFYVYEGTTSKSNQINNVCMIGSNSVKSRIYGMFIQQKRNFYNEGTWLVVKQVDACSASVSEEITVNDIHIMETVNYPMLIAGNIYCRFRLWRSRMKPNHVISIQAYPAHNGTRSSSKSSSCYSGLELNYGYFSTHIHKSFWWCMNVVEQFLFDKDFVYITVNSRTSYVKPFKLVVSLVENKYRDNCEMSYNSDFTQPLNIVSPFFEGNYAGAINCTWNVQSRSKYDKLELTVNKFTSPNFCAYSFLEIESRTMNSPIRYCDSLSTPVSTQFEGAFTIHFNRYDGSKTGGFNATITAHEPTKPCNGEWIFADTEPEFLVIHDELQNENGQCNYKITSPNNSMNIVVEPLVHDMGSCLNNRVVFHDGKTPAYDNQIGTLCGSSNSDTQTRYTAESGFMYIVFDASRDAKIKLKYYSESLTAARYNHLNALPRVQYFTSPNYPNPYEGNRNYTWVIETVKDRKIKLKIIDCYVGYWNYRNRRDTVIVYDGYRKEGTKILGQFNADYSGTVYESSNSSLTVVLVSVVKGASGKKGFNITYSQLEDMEAGKTSGASAIVVIVSSCVGAIVFMGLAGIFIYCFTYCRKKPTGINPPVGSYPPYNHNMAAPAHPPPSHIPTHDTLFAQPPYELAGFIPDVPPPSYEESARYEIKPSTISDAEV